MTDDQIEEALDRAAAAIIAALGSHEHSPEDEKDIDLMNIIGKSFDPSVALRRTADLMDKKVERDSGEIFAAGILSVLQGHRLLKDTGRPALLFARAEIAHWFRMHERYVKNKEI